MSSPTTYYLPPTDAKNGQTVLSLVFLIGGIIVLIGLSLAFISNTFINSAFGFRASQKAQAVASSGVYDALLRLARNKGLEGTYSVPLDGDSASVTVTQNSPAMGQVTIVSTSTVSFRRSGARVVVSVNASSGRTAVISWEPQ